MPLSFKAIIAAFIVFGVGAGVVAFACLQTGWLAVTPLIWGLLIAGAGLAGGFLFSMLCAATQPSWRRKSLIAGAVSLVLLAGLLLFARAA